MTPNVWLGVWLAFEGGLFLVFRTLKNARLHAVAVKLSDRRRFARSHPAGHTLCIARPQARDIGAGGAGDLCLFAARIPFDLSAGGALSTVGCRARRAGWH